jgi:hypothetical protein
VGNEKLNVGGGVLLGRPQEICDFHREGRPRRSGSGRAHLFRNRKQYRLITVIGLKCHPLDGTVVSLTLDQFFLKKPKEGGLAVLVVGELPAELVEDSLFLPSSIEGPFSHRFTVIR